MRVELFDYTKEPLKVLARATLVSYWSEWSIDKLEQITEKDAETHIPKVLGYGHESILEHIKLTWAIEGISRVTSHQLVRHRIASYTQRSQRYIAEDCKKIKEEVFHTGNFYSGRPVKVKVEHSCNIEEVFVIPESIKTPEVKEFFKQAMELYDKLIQSGIPPEDARFIFPQAVKTKIVVTMNFREFKHFAGLRMCERAQWEIRELARKMWEEVVKIPELKKLVIWSKVAPRCIQLGYCPERELMPEGCFKRQKDWWRKVTASKEGGGGSE